MTRLPTEFEQSVYNEITKIPRGYFTTYGVLAKRLGTSPRAVGQALKRNPFAPKVPCHRIVSADFNLGGYHGELNSCKKIELLQDEGIVIENGFVGLASRAKLLHDWNDNQDKED